MLIFEIIIQSIMKNILVPYDFTNFSDMAFEKAMEIAKKFDSNIILLTVIGSDVDTSGMNFTRAQKAQDEEESKRTESLTKLKDSQNFENVSISVEIAHDPSSSSGIINFAEKNNVDLIVMGSHGRSGFKKLVLGSVASKVISEADCNVLVVKQKED